MPTHIVVGDTAGGTLGGTYLNPTLVGDATQKAILPTVNGVSQALIGTLFTQTATQTVSNVGETTLFTTGIGTRTLPANFFVAGKMIRIMGAGIFSTQAAPGNVTIKIYLGSTAIASGIITNILALASNNSFEFMGSIICRTTGASGSVVVNGVAGYDTGALVQGFLPLNNAGATTTIDTTASLVVDVKLTWATQIAANTISTTTGSIEILN